MSTEQARLEAEVIEVLFDYCRPVKPVRGSQRKTHAPHHLLEWLFGFALVALTHIASSLLIHQYHLPLALPAKQDPGLTVTWLAVTCFAITAGLWLRFIVPHFVDGKPDPKRWTIATRRDKAVASLLLIILTPVFLMAFEATVVDAINGHHHFHWPRALVIAAWGVSAVFVLTRIQRLVYRVEVNALGDAVPRPTLLQFVSFPDPKSGADARLARLRDHLASLRDALRSPDPSVREAFFRQLHEKYLRGTDVRALEGLQEGIRHEFVQNLRGARPHWPMLQKIILLPSKDSREKVPDLLTLYAVWCEVMALLQPRALPERASHAVAIDYEDFELVQQTLGDVVTALGSEDLVIDITSGQKPNSATALLFSVGRQVQVQYVKRDSVVAYDVHPDLPVASG